MNMIIRILICAVLAGNALGAAPSIITFAGGRNDEGRAATAAALGEISDAAFDRNGNLYIADRNNNCVRRVDAAAGTITTVAGNGGRGFSGDGGPATLAALASPEGLAFDAADNLYIADNSNNRVRRVDAITHTITTVAGGGRLFFPNSLAFDAAGNLVVSDWGTDRIWRVDTATKLMTVVAGNSDLGFSGDGGKAVDAMLFEPSGMAVAPNGDIYFGDSGNHRVRKIAAATGVITTIAGGGGFLIDGVAATDVLLYAPDDVRFDAGGNLIITDPGNDTVRRVDAATKVITTLAGTSKVFGFAGDGGPAASAKLNFPLATAIDAAGNYYVVDAGNNRVRRIDASTKIITTIAGGELGDGETATSAQLLLPNSVAVDSSGNVYVGVSGDGRIWRIDAATHIASVIYTTSTSKIGGVTVDRFDNVYFADSTSPAIWKIDPVTKATTRIAGTGEAGFSGDGGPATAAKLRLSNLPILAFDAADNLYFSDTSNHRVRRVDAKTKVITTIAGTGNSGVSGENGPATAATLSSPTGIAIDGDGNLYIGESVGSRIVRVDAATQILTRFAGNGSHGSSGDGGPATAASLDFPAGLVLDSSGNIHFADANSHRIRRIDAASKIITTIAGKGLTGVPGGGFSGDGGLATNASLSAPLAVAIDKNGVVYIADSGADRIRVLTTIDARRRAARR